MKFNIYLRRFGKLIKLQKLSRTSNGLYFVLTKRRGSDHISYHEDGRYWIQSQGRHIVKKIRQPLSTFTGIETLQKGVTSVFGPMPDDRDEPDVRLGKEDLVIDFAGSFWIEIILSERVTPLPELPERLNAQVFVKNWKPIVTVEAFELADNGFPADRSPPSTEWIEGSNFLIHHTGRI